MHPPILAVIEPVFVEPIGKVLENLETPTLHPNQHVRETGLDRAIVELGVHAEHLEALRLVLIGQRLAGAVSLRPSRGQAQGRFLPQSLSAAA